MEAHGTPVTDRSLREALLTTAEARLLRIASHLHAPSVFSVHVADPRLSRLGAVPGALAESLTSFLREEYRARGWTARTPPTAVVSFGPLPNQTPFSVTTVESSGGSHDPGHTRPRTSNL